MWDFTTFVTNQFISSYWARKWAEQCEAAEDQGYVLIDHHFENSSWDQDAEILTFDQLVVRQKVDGQLFVYGMEGIQQANEDYLSRNWFSTVGRMA